MVPLGIKYDNFSDIINYTVKSEGFGGIFRGVRATVVINILNGQLEKLLKEPLSKLLGVDLSEESDLGDLDAKIKNDSELIEPKEDEQIEAADSISIAKDLFKKALGATLMTGAGLFLLYSMEYARIRVQGDIVTDGHRYFSNTFETIKKTVQSSGFLSLYTGYGITLLGLFGYKITDYSIKALIKE